MSFRYLDHTTDAFIEINAESLESAFTVAGISVIETTLDRKSVKECESREIVVSGKDLRYLLFNWLEEINYAIITEGFAIHRIDLSIKQNNDYTIIAKLFGEKLDLNRHKFKVEIKAPTFHLMEIKQDSKIEMRFLLDL